MLFDIIKLSGFYISIAYGGPCAEIEGMELPFAVEDAVYKSYQANNMYYSWCKIEYQVTLEGEYDQRREEEYLRQFITWDIASKPRMDLYKVNPYRVQLISWNF